VPPHTFYFTSPIWKSGQTRLTMTLSLNALSAVRCARLRAFALQRHLPLPCGPGRSSRLPRRRKHALPLHCYLSTLWFAAAAGAPLRVAFGQNDGRALPAPLWLPSPLSTEPLVLGHSRLHAWPREDVLNNCAMALNTYGCGTITALPATRRTAALPLRAGILPGRGGTCLPCPTGNACLTTTSAMPASNLPYTHLLGAFCNTHQAGGQQ